jgi:hypothetical protein
LQVTTDSSTEQTNNHNKEQAENTKKTRRKTAQEQNTNGKHPECDNLEKKKAANQKSSETESLSI